MGSVTHRLSSLMAEAAARLGYRRVKYVAWVFEDGMMFARREEFYRWRRT